MPPVSDDALLNRSALKTGWLDSQLRQDASQGQRKRPSRVSDDALMNRAALKAGLLEVQKAFRNVTFIYGTAGQGSAIVRGLKRWADRSQRPEYEGKPVTPGMSHWDTLKLQRENLVEMQRRKDQQHVIGRALNLFDPGRRAEEYLRNGYQMMDLYYGQAGTTLHTMRDPAIARFVHYGMDFEGDFSMQESGREAYLRTFKTNVEGWHNDTPSKQYYGQTATKEMSKLIRWGIKTFGGKLIFEGREVYYSQVFLKAKETRRGDTDIEAQELFQYFKPGLSKVAFGKGSLTFQWAGKETIPTHAHFLSNWHWGGQGVMHSSNNRTNNVMKENLYGNTKLDMFDIWNNFLDMPQGMHNMTLDQVVKIFIAFLR